MSDNLIMKHFSAISIDVTPEGFNPDVSVLYAPVSGDAKTSKHCMSILPDDELEQAKRIKRQFSRTKFVERRAFRRFCVSVACGNMLPLSSIEYLKSDLGQPYLANFPNLNVSFSSCQSGFLGAWSFQNKIGVDIETQTRRLNLTTLAHRYFSNAEAYAIEKADSIFRTRAFYQTWCLKEAALKSVGHGLPFGLEAFQFKLSPVVRMTHAPAAYGGPENFDSHIIEKTPCYAALVVNFQDRSGIM